MLEQRLKTISYSILYAALVFSVLWRGSDILWRQTVLQTLVFASFFFFAYFKLLSDKPIVEPCFANRPIVVLISLLVITVFFAQSKGLAFQALIQILSCIAGFYIFKDMAKHRDEQKRLIIVVALITSGLCMFGLLIHYEMYLFPSWELIKAYQNKNLSATFINHCHMAGWLEMAILFFIPLFFIKQRTLPVIMILLIILALMCITLVLTLARGGWISTCIGFCFAIGIAFFHRSFQLPKKFFYFILITGFAAGLFILGSSPVTQRSVTVIEQESATALAGRPIAWKGTLEMIQENLLTGVGPGNYATTFTQFQPPGFGGRFFKAHNDYLQFIAEAGIFVLPTMIWLIFVFFKKGFKNFNHPSRQTRWLTLGSMGGIFAILIHSFVDFNLQIPSNALLFTLLAAQVAAPVPALRKRITND